MKDNKAPGVAFCFLAVCTSASMVLQQPTATAQAPTIRVQSSLVLVDVIGQDLKRGLPVRDFKKEDFRLFDNRHEVRITTFDAGADTPDHSLVCRDLQRRAGSSEPRQNLQERNRSFDPHLIISRNTTPWELLI